jgi:hypothetical protein
MKLRLFGSALVLLLAATACADPAPGPGDGGSTGGTGSTGDTGGAGTTHPGGANDLVLRISTEGGFVPIDVLRGQIPGFSLFGDGTVITTGAQIEIYPGPALPSMIATPVSDEGVQVLLQAALDAGLGKDAQHVDLGDMAISDMPTTVFTLVVDGETHVTTVYALGAVSEQPRGTSDDAWAARQALERFATQVGDLRSWLPEGSVGEDAPYVPSAVRIFVGPYAGDPNLRQEPIAWPLATDLATIGEATDQGERCAVLEGADLDAVLPLAERANTLSPWTSGGERYAIAFRPLLPDESGC